MLTIVSDPRAHDPDFVGWAVYHNDPLWIWAKGQNNTAPDSSSFSWNIVLNKHLFRKFDYKSYRQALLSLMPERIVLPTLLKNDEDDITRLKEIWVILGERAKEQIAMPLKIIWVPNIPAPVTVSFLVPAETLGLANAVHLLPGLRFRPPLAGVRETWVGSVDMSPGVPSAKEAIPDLVKAVSRCMGNLASPRRDGRIEFAPPVPNSWLQPCIADVNRVAKVQFDVNTAEPADTIVSAEGDGWGFLRVPCAALHPAQRSDARNRDICAGRSEARDTPLGWFDAFPDGYRGGMIYVPDRNRVSEMAQALKAARDGAEPLFWLDSTYESALVKFQYISDVLEVLRLPLEILAVILAIYIVALMLGMIVDHRKGNYAVLVTNGISTRQIRVMLIIQLGLSCFVGGLAGGLLEEASKWICNQLFSVSNIAATGRDLLGTTETELLPLSSPTLGAVIAALVYLGSVLILLGSSGRRLRLRSSPIDLAN
jgi:hypothetical protein